MKTLFRSVAPALLVAALSSPLLLSGCAAHVTYYDPYYHDYHHWDDHEVVYYNQWEHDTHRDHVDFAKRNDADKKAYWDWRHNQH
jgi:hypothetical protein